MNARRKLIIALGAGALMAPLGSLAQQKGKVWRVGILSLEGRPTGSNYLGAFPMGMRELGYVEGKNLAIEWRFADGKVERLLPLAAELVQLKVDAIVASGTISVSAAQKATTTIPIVMGTVGDPVGSGLVKSLAHPGGNITGTSLMSGEIIPKNLELLRSMVPNLARVAVLMNSTNPTHATRLKDIQGAARRTGVTILSFDARAHQEIEPAFAMMKRGNAGAVVVFPHPIFTEQVRQIAELALKNKLPSVAGIREYVEAGGLMSYGSSFSDSFRRTATYVDKIFKGAKPADLPVEQPTKFELFINRKTAKTLGLTIPPELLLQADKVIE